MSIKVQGTTVIDDSRQLNVTGVSTLGTVQISSGIVTASSGIVTYYGDGSNLTGIQGGLGISTNTTNQAQYIPYATSFGSTTGAGATTLFVYNPSTNRLGIGITNPQANLHVVDEFLVAAGSATTQHITQRAYTIDNGSLSWEGTAGQLFSITNNLTSGSIFSVNDVSGIPSIDVDADGTIQLTPYADGNVGIATTNPTSRLHVVGDVLVTGVVTATTFSGNATSATYASNAGVSTNVIGGISSVTQLSVSGVSTLGTVEISSGIVTASSGIVTYYGDGQYLSGTGFSQDADGNLFAGTNAGGGYDPATGTSLYNIFLGENAGAAIANGDYNTFLGYEAGCSVTSGIHNIIFGCKAGCSLQTGSCNVFLGHCAASAATGSSNFVLGHEAGKCMTSGTGNILITHGRSADNSAAWTGSNTVAIGKNSGRRLCGSSSNNVFLGKYSGLCVTTGGSNIFIGDEAGCGSNAKTGSLNIAIGRQAGSSLSSGQYNIFFGTNAGSSNTTASDNVFIGKNAGQNYTYSEGRNVFIGKYAGKCATTAGYSNVFIGEYAGCGGAGGVYNIMIGTLAGRGASANTNASYCKNVFIGVLSGCNNDSGYQNTFLGDCSGLNNSSGHSNIAVGSRAGKCNTTGHGSVFVGSYAGCLATGACNTFLGYFSGNNLTSGNYNIAIGKGVQLPSATGSNQLVIGCSNSNWIAGDSSFNVTIANKLQVNASGIVTASSGIVTYYGDGQYLSGTGFAQDADGNLFAGTGAGGSYDPSTGSACYNIFLGCNSGNSISTGDDNIFLGRQAGQCNSSGSYNNFFGYYAGRCNSGSYNNFFGKKAGCKNIAGSRNNFIGCNAGFLNTYGGNNNFLGGGAGRLNVCGSHNNFFGFYAGNSNTCGCCNNFIGKYSGRLNTTGCFNNFLGDAAGESNTTGCYNTFLGSCAGNTNTTGCYNIAIGHDVELPSITDNNQFAIGSGTNRWIAGDSSFNVTIANKLQVNASGIVTASSGIVTYYGDGSKLTGIEGGFSISTETSNQAQYIPYATSFGSTTGAGATTLLVYNPSTTRLGIGTTNPQANLHVVGDVLVSGVVTTSDLVVRASDNTEIFSVSGIGSTTSNTIFEVTDFADNALIDITTDGDILLSPTGAGYVGIGTTNPTQPLDVHVESRFEQGIRVSAADTTSYYKIEYNKLSGTLDFTFVAS